MAVIDEIFVEALQINAKRTSNLICSIWKRCGELRYLIKPWVTAEMIQINKRGNLEQENSFRPVALLWPARKVIERGIANMMTKKHLFCDSQPGYQRETGMETAISGPIANIQRPKFSAVLGLKSAYNTVPRKQLMESVDRMLYQNLSAMIALTLQPMREVTSWDETDTYSLCEKGMSQGGPLSPPLFSLYMDTFAEDLEENEKVPQE